MKNLFPTSTHLYKDQLETPIGLVHLYEAEDRLVGLYPQTQTRIPFQGDLARAIPKTTDVLAFAKHEIQAYFSGKAPVFTVPLKLLGTPFQVAVWQHLKTIPIGTLQCYGELARTLGVPQAVRAVGAAVGRNPIGIIIPCHRVVGHSGHLTGYAGGLPTKAWLLTHEGHQIRANRIKKKDK